MPGSQAAPAGNAADYLLMHRVAIYDKGAGGQAVEAASILLPKDWKVESGVLWTQDIGCPRNSVKLSLKAHSPDGKLGFEVFPDYYWIWVDDPQARAHTNPLASLGIKGCDVLPPYDAVGYLQNLFLPYWRPGATLVGIDHVPELIQAMQLQFQALSGNQPSAIQTDFDAALAAIETPGTDPPSEEWVLASLMRSVAFMPVLNPMGGFGSQLSGNYNMAALAQFAARAPKGQLEKHEHLFEVIYRSFKLNPAWESAVARHFQTMDQINLKGIQDRQRIMRQTQQEIGAMIEQGYNARQAVIDRAAEKQIQALRGVETYVDPTTHNRVELTTGYQNAWSNGLGDYVLSNSPSFNPARELRGNWTELKPEGR
jgi:hypothetical protein